MDRFTASALALLVGLTLIVLGLADVGGSSTVSLVAGAALVLVPVVAAIPAPRDKRRRPC
jgi:hypothetical protein